VNGTLKNVGQHDWIAVTLTANQAYEVTVTGLSQYGQVTLGTAAGLAGDGTSATAIPSSNIGSIGVSGTTQDMYFMPATSGTYYIDLSDIYPVTASENYTVSVATTTADYTDNPTAPATVAVGGHVNGTLKNVGQHDWIAVTLTANQAYEVTVTGLSQYGQVTLGTATGLAGDGTSATAIPSSNIGSIGVSGTTQDMYFMPATSGTYYIDLSDIYPVTASENYTVSVTTTTADYTDNPTAPGTVAVNAPCYLKGTSIATEHGEILVENLRSGDIIQAHFAVQTPIIWIGHRRINCSRHPEPRKVWPVRVTTGAFGESLPRRDLYLSPDHAVFVDGVLIPIKHLINGTTINQVPMDDVTYYHVELPQHDVILAEGLPAESYLDTGDLSNFANRDAPVALHANFSSRIWEAMGCAPLVLTGALLETTRRRVNARFETTERFGVVSRVTA
jgi:hypothetical protein